MHARELDFEHLLDASEPVGVERRHLRDFKDAIEARRRHGTGDGGAPEAAPEPEGVGKNVAAKVDEQTLASSRPRLGSTS